MKYNALFCYATLHGGPVSKKKYPGVTGCFGSHNRHPHPDNPTEADQTPARVQVAF